MIELLPRSAYWTYADAKCRAQITGGLALARTFSKVLSSPSPVDPNARNGLLMPTLQLAPVMNLRGNASALRQSGFMQTERELDDVGNAFVGHALACLIFECLGVAACRQKMVLEMVVADDAQDASGRPAWCACASSQ